MVHAAAGASLADMASEAVRLMQTSLRRNKRAPLPMKWMEDGHRRPTVQEGLCAKHPAGSALLANLLRLPECVAVLNAPDPFSDDSEGMTPLRFATLQGHTKVCELLLAAGALPLPRVENQCVSCFLS